jgi:MFS family permease
MTSPAATVAGRAGRTRLPAQVWLAGGLTFLGGAADNVILLLLVWLAGPLGWTGLQTAVVILALRIPALATGFLVGRAVDAWGPRRVVFADLAVRAALLVLLTGISLAAGRLPLPAVLVVGAVGGAVSPGTYAAVRWMIPRLVPAQQLGRANAVVGLSDQLPLLVGGALVGPALALLGPAAAMAVPATMLLIALALAHRLRTAPPGPALAAGPGAPAPGRRRFPARVLALITLSTAYYFLYGPFETATPSFVREQLHAGRTTYSLLWTLFGLGATLALPLGALLVRRGRPGLVNGLGAAAWGVLMLPLLVLHRSAVPDQRHRVGPLHHDRDQCPAAVDRSRPARSRLRVAAGPARDRRPARRGRRGDRRAALRSALRARRERRRLRERGSARPAEPGSAARPLTPATMRGGTCGRAGRRPAAPVGAVRSPQRRSGRPRTCAGAAVPC